MKRDRSQNDIASYLPKRNYFLKRINYQIDLKSKRVLLENIM